MNVPKTVPAASQTPDMAPAPARYDSLSVFFHWAVFLLVAVAYAAMELKGLAGKGTPARALAMTVHEWAGVLVFALTVPRVLWRMVRGAPPPEPGPRLMRLAAGAMQWVLYLYTFLQPLLGLVALNAGGHLLELPGLAVPPIVAPDPQVKDGIKAIHETIGTAFYLVIGLHAMAALFHHYMLGDNTLRRMWRR